MSNQKHGKALKSNKRELVCKDVKDFDVKKMAGKCQLYGHSDGRKIKKEGPLVQESSSERSTNLIKERKRRPVLNHQELCALREIIERIYEDIEWPTVRKILRNARKELNFKGSRARMRGILRNKLGFKFNTRHPNNNLVLERNSIKLMRIQYLRTIKNNDALREKKRPVIYVGEKVISITRNGPKCMIIHAGNENGFIKDAGHIYTYNKNKEKPKPKEFLRYLKENLIPKLPQNCLVIMSYSSMHNTEIDAVPTILSTNEEIKKWLADHDIPFEEYLFKAELLVRIKESQPVKKYAVDQLLAEYGHTVQRIPPFNTDMNPIEYIWMKLKSRVVAQNVTDDTIIEKVKNALECITEDDWKEEIDRVKKIEERYWRRDIVKEDDYDELMCNIGIESDSDSNNDTDYEYNWSSSSSEESDCENSEG